MYIYCIYLLTIVIFYTWLVFINTLFLRNIFFGICWFFVVYWLISIFTFLFKKYQYNYYTSVIQRFWKRSLYLFWMLEFFLFIIYLFLTLISPQETLFMMDQMFLFLNSVSDLKNFFWNLFKLLVIILLFNVLILQIKYKNYYYFINFILLILLILVLREDFIQFYTMHQFYLFYEWVYKPEQCVWELENSNLKFRTITHYFYILIFLKFWHTVFIVVFFIFFDNLTFFVKKNTFNSTSANLQNMYFLFIFGFILKILYLKYYMNYLYEYSYYWFLVNSHFYSYSYILNLFDINYLFFFYNDLKNIF